MEVKRFNGIVTLSFYWDDLTDKAKDDIRDALGLESNDNNNWDVIPFAMLDINEKEETYSEVDLKWAAEFFNGLAKLAKEAKE